MWLIPSLTSCPLSLPSYSLLGMVGVLDWDQVLEKHTAQAHTSDLKKNQQYLKDHIIWPIYVSINPLIDWKQGTLEMSTFWQ